MPKSLCWLYCSLLKKRHSGVISSHWSLIYLGFDFLSFIWVLLKLFQRKSFIKSYKAHWKEFQIKKKKIRSRLAYSQAGHYGFHYLIIDDVPKKNLSPPCVFLSKPSSRCSFHFNIDSTIIHRLYCTMVIALRYAKTIFVCSIETGDLNSRFKSQFLKFLACI